MGAFVFAFHLSQQIDGLLASTIRPKAQVMQGHPIAFLCPNPVEIAMARRKHGLVRPALCGFFIAFGGLGKIFFRPFAIGIAYPELIFPPATPFSDASSKRRAASFKSCLAHRPALGSIQANIRPARRHIRPTSANRIAPIDAVLARAWLPDQYTAGEGENLRRRASG